MRTSFNYPSLLNGHRIRVGDWNLHYRAACGRYRWNHRCRKDCCPDCVEAIATRKAYKRQYDYGGPGLQDSGHVRCCSDDDSGKPVNPIINLWDVVSINRRYIFRRHLLLFKVRGDARDVVDILRDTAREMPMFVSALNPVKLKLFTCSIIGDTAQNVHRKCLVPMSL
jgi:hypothetical protein